MILTITLNPALDKTLLLEKFEAGAMSRAKKVFVTPSGKGIDVARTIKVLKGEVVATGFIPEKSKGSNYILNELKNKGIKVEFVKVGGGEVRNVYIILDSKNAVPSSLSEPSFSVRKEDINKLLQKVDELSKNTVISVIAGSVPNNTPLDIYRKLVRICKNNHNLTIVDAEDKLLKEALKEAPFLIKPNLIEAKKILNKKLNKMADVINACYNLKEMGAQNVLISLGVAGAILLYNNKIYRSFPPQIKAIDTTGAGGCLIGGLAYGLTKNKDIEEVLKLAIAAASACCINYGTANCKLHQIREFYKRVKVRVL